MKPVSAWQLATLREIANGMMAVQTARMVSDHTLYSLVKRGWVQRSGDWLALTEEGHRVYMALTEGGMPYRKEERELTDRTARLLKLVRQRREQAKGGGRKVA